MMKRILSILALTGLLFPNLLQGAEVRKSLAPFDLFSFSLGSLEQGLGERAQSLGKALSETFPKVFSKDRVAVNAYSGVCFKKEGERIRLAWADSETEGFRFSVEKLSKEKTCVSPFSEATTFKTYPLDPKRFFPISHGHPTIELGVSTADQIKAELGKPDYSDENKLIYFLKRDQEKEKGCGAEPAKGDFYGIEVIFDLTQGKLSGIWFNNTIAGEC